MKIVFGDPVRNIVRAEFLGDKKLLDHEHTVKDVCTNCNSALSPCDEAGAKLAKELAEFYNPTGKNVSFTRETVGWLLKTHLNHVRVIKDRESGEIYPVDQDIKHSLIRHEPLPYKKFKLLYEAWEGTAYFWDADDPRRINYFGYRSVRFRNQRIALSDFRFKTLTTWLLLPSDCDYYEFPARAESALREVKNIYGFDLSLIDVNSSVQLGRLNLERVLPWQKIEKFIFKR